MIILLLYDIILETMTPENEQIKVKIIDTSQRIQEVLLLLLSDNQDSCT